ncbi:MAG: hypothetical protein VYA18_07425 [Pseudomonadota bacterium]|nr:hypothetical protein [Pseudomonadota bacterium]
MTDIQMQHNAAVKQAVEGERARISAILEDENFKGREALGMKFINKGMSAADAADFLSSAPVENSTASALKPGAAQLAALERLTADNPNVGPDLEGIGANTGSSSGDPNTEAARAAARAARAAKYGPRA